MQYHTFLWATNRVKQPREFSAKQQLYFAEIQRKLANQYDSREAQKMKMLSLFLAEGFYRLPSNFF